ncbi:ricin-type beta-trefoil lectin domain protein [Streptomyces galbus]|uniref:ricin-type beta-trefoil lectin domain protein n=1 Tax=Streptomyces galbus TaxID=33898 RepID=UPI003815DA1B
MRKTRIAIGLGITATVVMAGTPAHAISWYPGIHEIKNVATGKCLSGSGRTVNQVTCGLPVSGGVRSTDWTFSGDYFGFVQLYKNLATGLCLDTNGTDVYLSGCNEADLGQQWWWDSDMIRGNHYPGDLTGWNAGGVSMTSGQEEASRKASWRIDNFGFEGGR